jgi:hypothetical protein
VVVVVVVVALVREWTDAQKHNMVLRIGVGQDQRSPKSTVAIQNKDK